MFSEDIIIRINSKENYKQIINILFECGYKMSNFVKNYNFFNYFYLHTHNKEPISIYYSDLNTYNKKILTDKEFLRNYKIKNLIYKNKIQ